MRLGLVINGVMTMPGNLVLAMVVRGRVIIIGDRGGARMGQQGKGGLSAHPVVDHHMHGGEKKGQKNSTTHDALHRERLGVCP
jgi:hypothetical protein